MSVPPPISVDHRTDNQPFLSEILSNERTPTTLFSDCPITTSEEYNKIINPERRTLMIILAIFVVLTPLMFRYICGSSNDPNVSSRDVAWGSGLDSWEWTVLVVLWLGLLGSIMRLLPVVSGRPAAIESSQKCKLDGIASLGLCSPFSSEDDAILLRSLLGRTCTAFHTVGSRHSYQGLYVDTILNERRIKGEAYRRNVWLSWMKFLHSLVDVCLLIKEQKQREEDAEKCMSSPGKDMGIASESCDDLFSASMDSTAPHLHQMASARSVYVDGILRGVARGSSANFGGGSTPHRRGPATFRDMGAAFDSSLAMSRSQQERLRDWAQTGTPLSAGIVLASPMRIQTNSSSRSQRQSRRESKTQRISTFSADAGDDAQGEPGGQGDPEKKKRLNRFLSKIAEGDFGEDSNEDSDDNIGEEGGSNGAVATASDMNAREADAFGMHRVRSLSDREQIIKLRTNDKDEDSENIDIEMAHHFSVSSDAGYPVSANSSKGFGMLESERSSSSEKFQGSAKTSSSPDKGDRGPPGTLFNTHSLSNVLKFTLPPLSVDILDPNTWASTASEGRNFLITPTPKARGITPRQAHIAHSYLRPHGIPNLELDMTDLLPMISFLDGWLEEMQQNEWTFDYHNPK
jgi:hypothetical protein